MNTSKNFELRLYIRKNKILYYELAQEIGINAGTFTKWIKADLSEKQEAKIRQAIENIVTRRNAEYPK